MAHASPQNQYQIGSMAQAQSLSDQVSDNHISQNSIKQSYTYEAPTTCEESNKKVLRQRYHTQT